MEEYDGTRHYTGQEWTDLLRAMDARQIKSSLKAAYRRCGNLIRNVAYTDLQSKSIRNASKMKRLIRVYVYPRGGGFMITVKPHGKQGYYTNHAGFQKPVLMWAQDGTEEREPRRDAGFVARFNDGNFRPVKHMGMERVYNFLKGAEQQGSGIIERELPSEIEHAAIKRMEKEGWV